MKLARCFILLSLLLGISLQSGYAAMGTTFADVPMDYFGVPYINTLVQKDILGGYPDGTFHPNQVITRAEAAKIAVNLAIQTGRVDDISSMDGGTEFNDVSKHQWYYYYIRLASKYSLVNGYKTASGETSGNFGPGDTLTRAEAAKILFLASYFPYTDTTVPQFDDVSPKDWYYDVVVSAYNLSMVDGYKDTTGHLTGNFGPNDPVTRGAFAKMAAMALYPKDREPFPTETCTPTPQSSSGTTMTGSTMSGSIMSGATMSGEILLESGATLPTCIPQPPRVILSCSNSSAYPHCELMKQRERSPFKFLYRYPFTDPKVRIFEGFSAYDGNLGDEVGKTHYGIDYALSTETGLQSFDVVTMHPGYAAQGSSPSWGKYVIVFFPEAHGGKRYATLYAHLENVPSNLPWYKVDGDIYSYTFLDTGSSIGIASTTGDTKDHPQLHMEIHEYDITTGKREKKDLYNINDTLSSGSYPQVGSIFPYDTHYWNTNYPAL